ncbi:hypothetical protein LPJ63_001209 [Coemansia sp. RSA 2711]|nr:hypothetical protein LPJ63_001209 [Coemansia sp. RSA 2711]
MAEPTDTASTQALAAAVAAAATAPGFPQAINPAVAQMQSTAPFPKLQPEADVSADQAAAVAAVSAALTGVATDPMTAATAAALSTAIAGAHMASAAGGGQIMAAGTTAVGMMPAMTTMAGAGASSTVLASLNHNAHDQMMEIMNTYHTTNAHRRRSSVEAAAAASSVLASIASSAKPYMDGDMAAAAAIAAAASPTSIAYSAGQSAHQQQQTAAAAALLAASSMNSVMLPTIPSGTASLRNTPPPGSSGDYPAVSDPGVSLAGFPASAFSTLSPQAFAVTDQATASVTATTLDIQSSLTSTPTARADSERKAGGRRRKAAGGAAAAVAAATAEDMSRYSSDDNDDEIPVDEDGMPLTPDAPGSGRPGSLRHLTADERRARRLQRNRLAAKECRQKKKAYIQNLEDQVSSLQDENAQLRKDIEELNAKLTLGGMRTNSSAASTPVLESKRVIHAEHNGDSSMDSLPSPSLVSKRPRVAVRSTSSTKLQNGDY